MEFNTRYPKNKSWSHLLVATEKLLGLLLIDSLLVILTVLKFDRRQDRGIVVGQLSDQPSFPVIMILGLSGTESV